MNEFRIQGVKTNVPFLVNVLSHKDFLSGNLNTRFIENHPELFRFPESLNKAHKLVRRQNPFSLSLSLFMANSRFVDSFLFLF